MYSSYNTARSLPFDPIRQACYDSIKCIAQWKTHSVLSSAISLLIGGTTHWVLCSCSLEPALSRVSPCGYSVSMQCPGPWRSPLDPVSEPSTSSVHLLQPKEHEGAGREVRNIHCNVFHFGMHTYLSNVWPSFSASSQYSAIECRPRPLTWPADYSY